MASVEGTGRLDRASSRRIAVWVGGWTLLTGLAAVLGWLDGAVADDAFYYFEIARNASRGLGFSFDEIAPTNGFHPLWAWILVPVYAVAGDSAWIPVRAALVFSVLLTAGTAVLLHGVFARHRCYRAGELIALVWLLNPFTLLLAFKGLECPLNAFVLMTCLDRLDALRHRRTYTMGEFAVLGALVGASMLARTENVFWAAAVGLALLVGLRGTSTRRVARLAVTAASALIVVSPWIVWNWITFGSLLQASQLAKERFQLYGSLPELGTNGGLDAIGGALRNLWLVAEQNARFVAGEEFSPMERGYWVLAVAAIYLAGAILLPLLLHPSSGADSARDSRPPDPNGPRHLFLPMGIFLVLHFSYYCLYAGSYYYWYFLPPVLMSCVYVGQRLALLLDRPSTAARRRVVVWGSMLPLAASIPILYLHHVELPRNAVSEEDVLAVAEQVTGRAQTVGLWNAGFAGYLFSFHYPELTLVNLDGVVNNQITRLPSEQYEDYVADTVDAVLESPISMALLVGPERAHVFTRTRARCAQRVAKRLLACFIRR